MALCVMIVFLVNLVYFSCVFLMSAIYLVNKKIIIMHVLTATCGK